METVVDEVRARPGGRSARVRAAVHRAVVDLLGEQPAEALTIPVIAARAGVHPTTVYRRWRTLGELLADVAASRFAGDLVVPDTGELRGDLEKWAGDVATDLADPDTLAVLRAAIGAAGVEGGHACVADRHDQLKAMLRRDVERGGSERDLERVADSLLGPLYYRAIFTETPMSAKWVQEIVDDLLR
jgi:AcrR family transcriptional regulator